MQGGWLLTSCDYNSKLVSGFDKEGEGRKKQELIAFCNALSLLCTTIFST